jgi:hypothetical protein
MGLWHLILVETRLLRSTLSGLRTVIQQTHVDVRTVETFLAANKSVAVCAQAEKLFADLDANKRGQIFC